MMAISIRLRDLQILGCNYQIPVNPRTSSETVATTTWAHSLSEVVYSTWKAQDTTTQLPLKAYLSCVKEDPNRFLSQDCMENVEWWLQSKILSMGVPFQH